jgi:hypothetical protein
MATFYLLPPRAILEESFGRFLNTWLPGLHRPVVCGAELAALLQDHLADRTDVFVVFREDLPDGIDCVDALRDAFGVEVGDEVVELRLAAGERVTSRSWRMGAMAAA